MGDRDSYNRVTIYFLGLALVVGLILFLFLNELDGSLTGFAVVENHRHELAIGKSFALNSSLNLELGQIRSFSLSGYFLGEGAVKVYLSNGLSKLVFDNSLFNYSPFEEVCIESCLLEDFEAATLDIIIDGNATLFINRIYYTYLAPEFIRNKKSFIVPADGTADIDLNGFFKGRELTYLASSNDNLAVSIDGSKLRITPRTNFTGVSQITLIASDGIRTVRQAVNVSVEKGISEAMKEVANAPMPVDSAVIDELELFNETEVIVFSKENNLNFLNKKVDEFSIASQYDYELKKEYKTVDAVAVKLTTSGFEKLKANPNVEAVYHDAVLSISLNEAFPLINAVNLSVGGADIGVCVLDTGSNIAEAGYNFVEDNDNISDINGHGSMVSSIILRIAPSATIIAAKVCDNSGLCKGSNVLAGLDYCVDKSAQFNISIISGSFGDNREWNNLTCPSYFDLVLSLANNKSIVSIFSAGNENYRNGINYPACSPYAISVGASTKNDTITAFTNLPADILAPGVNINTSFGVLTGTSASVSFVSGAAALIREINKTISPVGVRRTIVENGKLISVYPRLDVSASLNNILEWNETIPLKNETGELPDFKISQTTCGATLTANTNLTESLNSNGTCFTIGANDVTLDCFGNKLSGNRSGYGINAQGKTGLSIKNCEVEKFYIGLAFNHTNSSLIENSSFHNNSDHGVFIHNSYSSIIKNSTTIQNTDEGVRLENSSHSEVYNHTAISNYVGVDIYYGANNTVYNGSFKLNTISNIYSLSTSNNTIDHNNIENSTLFDGITLDGDINSRVFRNSIKNSQRHSIGITDSVGNEIFNNTLDNDILLLGTFRGTNIYLSGINNTNIYNNYLAKKYGGIQIIDSVGINVTNNTITHHGNTSLSIDISVDVSAGIILYSGTKRMNAINIINNSITHNLHGIYTITAAANVNISGNSFINNTATAILAVNLINSTIENNNIQNSGNNIQAGWFKPLVYNGELLTATEKDWNMLTLSEPTLLKTTVISRGDTQKTGFVKTGIFNSTGTEIDRYNYNTNWYARVQTRGIYVAAGIYNITVTTQATTVNLTTGTTPSGFIASNYTNYIYSSAGASIEIIGGDNNVYKNNIINSSYARPVVIINTSNLVFINNSIYDQKPNASTYYIINTKNITFDNTTLKAPIEIEDQSFGIINFTNNIQIDSPRTSQNILNITQNKVYIKSSTAPEFNTTAVIVLKNLSFANAYPTVDFNDDGVFNLCPSDICTKLSYVANNLTFNVTHFTTYSSKEAEEALPQGKGGARGTIGISPSGSYGGVMAQPRECIIDEDCPDGKRCANNQCTELFDLRILRSDSPIRPGDALDFTFFMKSMSNIDGDVTIEYWLQKPGSTTKLARGQDVIYMNGYQTKIEDASLNVFNDMIGSYELVIQLILGSYTIQAVKSIEIMEKAPTVLTTELLDFQPPKFRLKISTNRDYELPVSIKEIVASKDNKIILESTKRVAVTKTLTLEESLTNLPIGEYKLTILTEADGDRNEISTTFVLIAPLVVEQPRPATSLKSLFFILMYGVGVIGVLTVILYLGKSVIEKDKLNTLRAMISLPTPKPSIIKKLRGAMALIKPLSTAKEIQPARKRRPAREITLKKKEKTRQKTTGPLT